MAKFSTKSGQSSIAQLHGKFPEGSLFSSGVK